LGSRKPVHTSSIQKKGVLSAAASTRASVAVRATNAMPAILVFLGAAGGRKFRIWGRRDLGLAIWIDDPWNGILLAKSGVRIHDIGGEHVCAAECWSGLVQRSLWFQHLPGASYRRNMPRLWAKMAHGTRA
jgi:hypothetical protein